MYTIVNLVAAGMGISIVPSSVDVFQRKGVVFLPLTENPPSVPLYTAWRTDVNQEVISRFMKIVDDVVEV
jgi:DNA-binding transcriptional LysR family regulator